MFLISLRKLHNASDLWLINSFQLFKCEIYQIIKICWRCFRKIVKKLQKGIQISLRCVQWRSRLAADFCVVLSANRHIVQHSCRFIIISRKKHLGGNKGKRKTNKMSVKLNMILWTGNNKTCSLSTSIARVWCHVLHNQHYYPAATIPITHPHSPILVLGSEHTIFVSQLL